MAGTMLGLRTIMADEIDMVPVLVEHTNIQLETVVNSYEGRVQSALNHDL